MKYGYDPGIIGLRYCFALREFVSGYNGCRTLVKRMGWMLATGWDGYRALVKWMVMVEA